MKSLVPANASVEQILTAIKNSGDTAYANTLDIDKCLGTKACCV